MKKHSRILALVLCMLVAVSLFAGCSKEEEKKTVITVGCMPLNVDAVEAIAETIEGYELDIKVFDGNNLPAEALKADEIDCLILNHLPWIKNFNNQNGCELTLVDGYAYASLFGFYSYKHDSVDAIPEGGSIIVSNDPSNMDRSLTFMQDLGLIKLGEKSGEFYTVLDIAENPKKLEIIEVETTSTAGSYKDADASISFTSVMLNAGIDPNSMLADDGRHVDFPTGIIVNKGDEGSDWAKAMVKATQTEKYAELFNEAFKGAYRLFDFE